MSQAESAPLGSVAAKVEVVGSGIGWDDMVLHYSPDVDAIVIDLTPAKQVIDETVALSAPSDAFLDVDANGRGVRIEFLDASAVFACHFCDHSGDDADGRQPLEWRARYESDRLTLTFVADADGRAVAASDMDEGIIMHTDKADRIVALSIADASKTVHRRTDAAVPSALCASAIAQ